MTTTMISRAAIVVGLLSVSVTGFAPSHQSYARVRSSLSMSSALIVQNKGGGHGELGKIVSRTQFGMMYSARVNSHC